MPGGGKVIVFPVCLSALLIAERQGRRCFSAGRCQLYPCCVIIRNRKKSVFPSPDPTAGPEAAGEELVAHAAAKTDPRTEGPAEEAAAGTAGAAAGKDGKKDHDQNRFHSGIPPIPLISGEDRMLRQGTFPAAVTPYTVSDPGERAFDHPVTRDRRNVRLAG